MTVVIDASVTLAWVYDDERTAAIERAFAFVIDDSGWVPGIWHLEVANGLQQGIRQKRIDTTYRNRVFADLADLQIFTDENTNTYAWSDTLALADRFALTPYDATYLELAHRRKLPLASLDRELRTACHALRVDLLGL